MNPITQDIIHAMARRRAAGERVSVLAGELGLAWQKLEKLTRCRGKAVPEDPRLLRKQLRWARLMLNAVPHLGCDKPWAIAWRQRLCQRLRRRIACLQRRLSALDGEQQAPAKPPRLWKPRPASPADARIRRQYDTRGTGCLWSLPCE
jgi:hypothetical protein